MFNVYKINASSELYNFRKSLNQTDYTVCYKTSILFCTYLKDKKKKKPSKSYLNLYEYCDALNYYGFRPHNIIIHVTVSK